MAELTISCWWYAKTSVLLVTMTAAMSDMSLLGALEGLEWLSPRQSHDWLHLMSNTQQIYSVILIIFDPFFSQSVTKNSNCFCDKETNFNTQWDKCDCSWCNGFWKILLIFMVVVMKLLIIFTLDPIVCKIIKLQTIYKAKSQLRLIPLFWWYFVRGFW